MSSSHVDQAGTLFGAGAKEFRVLVGQDGQNRARLAEILVKGQTAAQIMQVLSASPTSQTQGFSFQWSPATGGPGAGKMIVDPTKVDQTGQQQVLTALDGVLSSRCVACHGGAGPDGKPLIKGKGDLFPDGVDVRNFLYFNQAQRDSVIQAITSGDMPRAVSDMTKRGAPLTDVEKRPFLLALPKMSPVKQ